MKQSHFPTTNRFRIIPLSLLYWWSKTLNDVFYTAIILMGHKWLNAPSNVEDLCSENLNVECNPQTVILFFVTIHRSAWTAKIKALQSRSHFMLALVMQDTKWTLAVEKCAGKSSISVQNFKWHPWWEIELTSSPSQYASIVQHTLIVPCLNSLNEHSS